MMCYRVRIDGKERVVPVDVLLTVKGGRRAKGIYGLMGVEVLDGPFEVKDLPRPSRAKDATGNLFGPDAEYVDVKY